MTRSFLRVIFVFEHRILIRDPGPSRPAVSSGQGNPTVEFHSWASGSRASKVWARGRVQEFEKIPFWLFRRQVPALTEQEYAPLYSAERSHPYSLGSFESDLRVSAELKKFETEQLFLKTQEMFEPERPVSVKLKKLVLLDRVR